MTILQTSGGITESGCQTMTEAGTITDKEQLTDPGIKVNYLDRDIF